jgi:hypothetical protein
MNGSIGTLADIFSFAQKPIVPTYSEMHWAEFYRENANRGGYDTVIFDRLIMDESDPRVVMEATARSYASRAGYDAFRMVRGDFTRFHFVSQYVAV